VIHRVRRSRRFSRRPLLARPAFAADRPHLPPRHPRALLVQLSARRVSTVPRLRPRHRNRLPPRDARPLALDRRRRHQVLGERGLRRLEEGPARLCQKEENPTDVPFASLTAGTAALRHRRRARLRRGERQDLAEILVRTEGVLPLAGEEHLQDARARLPLALPGLQPLPRLRRTTPPTRGALLEMAGPHPPRLYQLPVSDLLRLLGSHPVGTTPAPAEATAPRSPTIPCSAACATSSRSASATSPSTARRRPFPAARWSASTSPCLGTSLVDTLFVLDEPSVGLHPRDIDRLIAIIRSLTDAGNTVVVVEHDEAMIRAADHLIEVGPEPGSGAAGGSCSKATSRTCWLPASITGRLPLRPRVHPGSPPIRRPVGPAHPALHFTGATKHNVVDRQLPRPAAPSRLPQRRLRLRQVHPARSRHPPGSAHPAPPVDRGCRPSSRRSSDLEAFDEIVLVDQSPLSRTPRSNPALYTEAWDLIRDLYAGTPAAQAAGFNASSFSFNSGEGRCDHCLGLGYERVEMQFLSDVFVPCPVCEVTRFKPEVLAIRWRTAPSPTCWPRASPTRLPSSPTSLPSTPGSPASRPSASATSPSASRSTPSAAANRSASSSSATSADSPPRQPARRTAESAARAAAARRTHHRACTATT
jgi:hypothetical protein